MFQYLEKIDPEKRQMRFYALTLGETLFGEWCLTREWGRIGSKCGQRMCHYGSSRAEVLEQMEAIAAQKLRRGYVLQDRNFRHKLTCRCSRGHLATLSGIAGARVLETACENFICGEQRVT